MSEKVSNFSFFSLFYFWTLYWLWMTTHVFHLFSYLIRDYLLHWMQEHAGRGNIFSFNSQVLGWIFALKWKSMTCLKITILYPLRWHFYVDASFILLNLLKICTDFDSFFFQWYVFFIRVGLCFHAATLGPSYTALAVIFVPWHILSGFLLLLYLKLFDLFFI